MRGRAIMLACVAGCGFSGLDPGAGVPDAAGLDPVADAEPAPATPDALLAVDAALPPDAALTVTCPESYNLARDDSRYRVAPAKQTWLAAEADCEADTGGLWSHLVALDDDGEWSAVVGTAANTHPGEWWAVGVVRDAASPEGPWRLVTGGAAPFLPWRHTTFGSDEPNNSGGAEPVVVLDTAFDFFHDPDMGGLIDVSVGGTYYYLCECDGRPPVDAAP